MAKYAYPAVFKNEDDVFYVNFPDIKNCFTDGRTIPEAIEMAEDVLALMLVHYEENDIPIPEPSDIKSITTAGNETVSLVYCDTIEYRKLYDGHIVDKTVSIPNWLNTLAEKEGIDCSHLFRQALMDRLNVT